MTEISIFTEQGFATTLKIAEVMVKSGVLPRGIDNPFKAFAIIQKGREMGVDPMRALTGIYLIEGKTVVSPELKLECFKQRGGRVSWVESTDKVAHCLLKAADGTEHHETVTIQEMASAGLTSKDNWRKYPKSMLRARCVAFALRAMGEGDGSYTPDELGADTDAEGAVTYSAPSHGVSESPERIAGNDSQAPVTSSRPVPANRAATVGPETLDADVLDPPGGAPPPSKPRTAADVKSTGGPITPDQVKMIHTLKGKVGGLTDEAYRKGVAVYRQADGNRCVGDDGFGSSKLLSKDQASHLINRFEDKIRSQAARAGTGVDITATVKPKDNPPALMDMLETVGDHDSQANWLHAHFGHEYVKELDKTEAETALQLLLAMSEGADVYDAAETKARIDGRIR